MNPNPPSPPLRLLILIGAYAPIVGGGERHAQLLAETLVRNGHSVRVLTRRTRRDLPRFELLNGVTVHRVGPSGFPRWGKYLMMPAALWRIRRLRKDYDVLQVCAFRVLGWVGWWTRLRTGKPVVLRAEACGEWSGDFSGRPPTGVWGRFLCLRNSCFLRCDRFLSISRVIREEYLSGGIPEEKILGITNGIDLNPFRAPQDEEEKLDLRRGFGWPVEGRHWCYVGKLIRGKGLGFLLEVFAGMASTFPDLHLVLVGSGGGQYLDCEDELRQQARHLGIAGRVVFTGYSDQVPAMLRACDGMVFPSEAESLGLAPVEAMATRLPVIVSDIGGLRDVVEDGVSGLRVPVGDAQAWTRAWTTLLEDPARAGALAAAGQTRAVETFNIEQVAPQTARAFTALV